MQHFSSFLGRKKKTLIVYSKLQFFDPGVPCSSFVSLTLEMSTNGCYLPNTIRECRI